MTGVKKLGLICFVLLVSVACSETPTPTPPPKPSATLAPSPTASPTAAPTATATVTPTPPALALFPGFIDTGCYWNVPLGQLLECLSKFSKTAVQTSDKSYVARRETIKAADGRTFDLNVLDRSGKAMRNIDGTAYWDLSALSPTPTPTRMPVTQPTPTPVPQMKIGNLRFYGFRDEELKYIGESLQWVSKVDQELALSVTSASVSIYLVEPSLLDTVAAISGLEGVSRQGDMVVPFSGDRINMRSDYVAAVTAEIKGNTRESNQAGFFGLLARHVRLVQEYRRLAAAGRTLKDCSSFTPQEEHNVIAAGFKAQLAATQRMATQAVAKGLVASQDPRRNDKVKSFTAEMDQWIKDQNGMLAAPHNYVALCYPPTATPVPTPVPPTATPTLAPGMGALIVVNHYSDAVFTIGGPGHKIAAGGQATITLPAGRYNFTTSYGPRSVNGTITVQSGVSARFELPPPP